MRTVGLYKTYTFKTQDPVIDRLHTMQEDSGLSIRQIKEKSNVSDSTLRNWFNGHTRRPMYCTVMAVAVACGYKPMEWEERKQPNRSKNKNKRQGAERRASL